MKIVHIVPGSGGTFYCQNCMRDGALVKGMRSLGHDVVLVPMYLPLFTDDANAIGDSPVFYGAINVYLEERFPFFRRAPRWFRRALDTTPLLAMAARKAGSTRAEGLEDMTLSVLRGEDGNQAAELDRMVAWLEAEGRPDVIHLSNALLLGLARRIKERLGVPVVCSLQDEHQWLDTMDPAGSETIWRTMAERATEVDAFVAVSDYYAGVMSERLEIPSDRMHVVHLGIDVSGSGQAALRFEPPTIGYLSRLSESLGLGLLVEAFLMLRRDARLRHLKLRATGGQTGDDAAFLSRLRRKVNDAGAAGDVEFVDSFDRASRLEFLRSVDILSVPVLEGEAFGTYMLEALASAVPVVQPELGGFPEIVTATGGGLLYAPNDAEHLARALKLLLRDPDRARGLGRAGRVVVRERFTIRNAAQRLVDVYGKL